MFALCAPAIATAAPPSDPDKPKLIVHEWGTFLSVQGSDGVTVGGVVDSEEPLPPFVEARGPAAWEHTMFRQQIKYKMETPVTYFYADRPLSVRVRVNMPKGILTHWFPVVRDFGPPLTRKPEEAKFFSAKDSFIDWSWMDLIPDNGPHSLAARRALRPVSANDPWRFARQTDAAIVRIHTGRQKEAGRPHNYEDYEKFLFYRGLGAFELPLQVRSTGDSASTQLALHNRSPYPLRQLFAIQVTKDALRFAALDDLPAGGSRQVIVNSILGAPVAGADGVAKVKKAVASSLASAGLYAKEADAMVNTWEHSYFRTPGLRILYALPRETVDDAIPIQIKPPPDQLVRIMVGRVEVLTPGAERQVEKWVAELSASDPEVRRVAQTAIRGLGRLQEPVLRRIAVIAKTQEVRRKAQGLLNEDSVAGPRR